MLYVYMFVHRANPTVRRAMPLHVLVTARGVTKPAPTPDASTGPEPKPPRPRREER